MTITRTIYGVRPRVTWNGETKAILVVREDDKVVEVKDFGFECEFSVVRVLREYTGLEFDTGGQYSTTAFRKIIGSLKGLYL